MDEYPEEGGAGGKAAKKKNVQKTFLKKKEKYDPRKAIQEAQTKDKP